MSGTARRRRKKDDKTTTDQTSDHESLSQIVFKNRSNIIQEAKMKRYKPSEPKNTKDIPADNLSTIADEFDMYMEEDNTKLEENTDDDYQTKNLTNFQQDFESDKIAESEYMRRTDTYSMTRQSRLNEITEMIFVIRNSQSVAERITPQ